MCDTMVTLTAEGVLFAKNSDRDPNEAQILEWYRGRDHQPDTQLKATWIKIPQAPRTFDVVISRPWWMWGAEMGANEFGVTIGNEAVFTKESLSGDPGLLGMDLLRLALERSRDRHQAVETIVGLLEKYGQVGSCSVEHPSFAYHNSFLVADPAGAIVLETAGRKWATEEVRGPARSISNGLSIPGFADRYSDPLRSAVSRCERRRAITEAGASGSESVLDLIRVLSDNGTEGGPSWSLLTGSLAGPNAHGGGLVSSSQTVSSWVADLRGRPQHWVSATADAGLSLFKPVAVDRPSDLGAKPTNGFDAATVWWEHELLHRLALRDWERARRIIRPVLDRVQARWLENQPSTEDAFAEARQVERWCRKILVELPLIETRPRWVQRQWATYNRQALRDR